MASLLEPKSQWCESHQFADLEYRSGSPPVVHSVDCHYLLVCSGSAALNGDANFPGLSLVIFIRANICY